MGKGMGLGLRRGRSPDCSSASLWSGCPSARCPALFLGALSMTRADGPFARHHFAVIASAYPCCLFVSGWGWPSGCVWDCSVWADVDR